MSEESAAEAPSSHAHLNLPTTRKCGLCKTIPDFQLYLQFGPSVDRSTRLKIERYIKNSLSSSGPRSTTADHLPMPGRKRRRYNDDAYDDGHNADADADRGVDSGLSIAFYDQNAGFDLDTTADDAFCQGIDYERGTNEIIGLHSDANMGNLCFNCSMPGHELRDCPTALDNDRIQANRDAFKERGSGQFNSRLYLAVDDEKRMEEMRKSILPGQPLSLELREALGLCHGEEEEAGGYVPEFIERMYLHGYPPAYLGTKAGEDPMCARAMHLSPSIRPPTPQLHIYNDAADYENGDSGEKDEQDTQVKQGKQVNAKEALHSGSRDTKASNEMDATGSDEEGAISDGELDAEPETESERKPSSACQYTGEAFSVPLVMYPGLDLAEFDFASISRPGRPLRPRTPYNRMHALNARLSRPDNIDNGGYQSANDLSYYDNGGSGYYNSHRRDGYSNGRSYRAPYDEDRYHGRRDHREYRESYDDRRSNSLESRGSYRENIGENYDRSVESYASHQHQPPPPDSPPPLLPQSPSNDHYSDSFGAHQLQDDVSQPKSQATTLAGESQGQTNPSATDILDPKPPVDPANGDTGESDGEIEDGECDMEESD
ncbi:hypothetical protein BX661DRAFT_168177 [Kickxella alabastrina]|uniref:uncharacterized protein n=1 Tax=Kickxella alabastrina TaxID=61397 RepID=UPI002220B580|nr:uncharacterized protein BX661DRAFT_168177 [Kickxella alabastrina]KAI7834996.1 hypothetical protein BX661DRAFT_168177 [Kickxella alabastrina]KAJ1947628.1 hypothetical protein GGF37_000211 [Kickxella alabastrina]